MRANRIGARLTLLFVLLSPLIPIHSATAQMVQLGGEVGVIGGSVSRSIFTDAIVNREPRDRLTELPNNKQYIYYFSELKGMTGQVITHRWVYKNTIVAEVKFNVGSPRWRVWSGATLKSNQLGTWEVQLVNELNQVIHTDHFNYIPNPIP